MNLLQLGGSLLYYVTPLLAAYFWSPSLAVLIPVTVRRGRPRTPALPPPVPA